MTDESTARDATETLRGDPTLEPYVEEYGPLTLDPASDPFERLVVSILRQQVSMDAASAIRERLFDAVEVTPKSILDTDTETLTDAGLSAAKVEYVTATARAFLEEGYSSAYFVEMDDEAVLEELTDIRGVGPWTGKMFLLFALGREDVFPVEDLGIRRGIEIVCEDDMTRSEMCKRAAEWKPYRSYASLYLWRAYEG
jgi:DNA-3-methyladenine glycosylase II